MGTGRVRDQVTGLRPNPRFLSFGDPSAPVLQGIPGPCWGGSHSYAEIHELGVGKLWLWLKRE